MTTSEDNQGCFKMRIIEYHDVKTLLGPCFVSFSLPLLIPGVVLTVVGSYGNENSFPLFGGWHITGIVTLAIAVILLFSGIILKCCYKPIISADIEQHLSPTSSMITGNKNLGYEDEIFTSKNAQNSNKVGHHDLKNSHTVASTHEAKHKKNKDPNNQFLANTAKSENQSKVKPEAARASLNAQHAPEGKSSRSSNRSQPPSYEHVQDENKRRTTEDNVTTNVVQTTQGNVTTKVTATITAEVETAQASGSRDNSSDVNENSKFLPAKKKKKKKKRKRTLSSSTDATDGDVTSRSELPELRMRPVLIHEGEEHHHHNLHVHFKNGSLEPKESTNSENELESIEKS